MCAGECADRLRLEVLGGMTAKIGRNRRNSRGEDKGRPGRLSLEEYTKRVTQVLRCTPFELNDCTALAQLPGVQVLAKQ